MGSFSALNMGTMVTLNERLCPALNMASMVTLNVLVISCSTVNMATMVTLNAGFMSHCKYGYNGDSKCGVMSLAQW